MLKLSQKDPRWGWKPIGKSNSLIKDWGCTITCISMISDYYGCFQDPGWMAKNLSFIVDRVIWQSIAKKLCFSFINRYYTHNQEKFVEAINDPKMACILNVFNRHWVVAAKKLPGGYWTIDPWTGSGKLYANSSISGGTTFKKN